VAEGSRHQLQALGIKLFLFFLIWQITHVNNDYQKIYILIKISVKNISGVIMKKQIVFRGL
jgi:hypothetical protein